MYVRIEKVIVYRQIVLHYRWNSYSILCVCVEQNLSLYMISLYKNYKKIYDVRYHLQANVNFDQGC